MRRPLSACGLLVGAVVLGFSAGQADAAPWPASVVGVWQGFANTSAVTLRVSTQGAAGACRAITGTLTDVGPGGQSNPVRGFYCPSTGRFSFLRNNATTGRTFQVYSGNLSDAGRTLQMSGIFAEEHQAGALGEYSFYATK